MARIPIGLQLFSVREQFAEQPEATLHAVADMGYEGVEFAGMLKWTATELRQMLRQTGLVCYGWHMPVKLLEEKPLEEIIAYNQELGCRSIIAPSLGAQTAEQWLQEADRFNQLAETLAPLGMETGFHNHHREFSPLENGKTAWDIFFSNTRDDVVAQLDLGNAICGGANVLQLLRTYPGRFKSLHLKPYSKQLGSQDLRQGFAASIGQDDVPWREVFQIAATSGGTKVYIVEYESKVVSPLEGSKQQLHAVMGYLGLV